MRGQGIDFLPKFDHCVNVKRRVENAGPAEYSIGNAIKHSNIQGFFTIIKLTDSIR